MKRAVLLALILAVLLSAAGCQSIERLLFPVPPSTPSPEQEDGASGAQQGGADGAERLSGEGALEAQDGTTLVHYQAELPLFSPDEGALAQVNRYYRQEYSTFVSTVEEELRAVAQANLESHELTGSTYMACEARQSYVIGREDERYLSVSRTITMSFGSETVESYLKGDTFDLETGERIRLGDLFRVPSEEYLPLLRDEVARQIRSLQQTDASGRYFDSAPERVEEFLMEDNFWLESQSLVLFFPEGTLGPTGTQSFPIAYDQISDLLTEGIQ